MAFNYWISHLWQHNEHKGKIMRFILMISSFASILFLSSLAAPVCAENGYPLSMADISGTWRVESPVNESFHPLGHVKEFELNIDGTVLFKSDRTVFKRRWSFSNG
jgi:hypothetical protein